MSKTIVKEMRRSVIKPVLWRMRTYSSKLMDSRAAENLLLGTAAVESRFEYLEQVGGPAVSIYQLEPQTIAWLAEVAATLDLEKVMVDLGLHSDNIDTAEQLKGNLYLATFFARLRYWVAVPPLPPANDVFRLARYWKMHYNTHSGKGRVAKFEKTYEEFVS